MNRSPFESIRCPCNNKLFLADILRMEENSPAKFHGSPKFVLKKGCMFLWVYINNNYD